MLTHTSAPQPEDADMTLTLSRAALLGVATGQIGPERFADAGVEASGDPGVLQRLLACLQDPDPDFPILTPAEV